MSKAKEIEGLDCEADVLDWAEKILRVRFDEIIEKRGSIFDSAETVKGVHDMRVATRRLRSALRDFASLLKRKPLEKTKKDLKKIADALGEVRDQDVAIIALKKLRKKATVQNIKIGIDELIEERNKRREQAQLQLLEKISATALKDLKARFEKAISKAVKKEKSSKTISFNRAGKKVVGKSLKDFCALTNHIYEPLIDKPLHELRISAKRLRYAIELYTACWGERIEPFAEQIAKMQTFLGEVHDADLWLESLSRTLKIDENKNPANGWLLSEFVEKRTKNYRSALKLWSQWTDSRFIEELKDISHRL